MSVDKVKVAIPLSLLFLFVATGAFGAHAMKEILSDQRLDTWQTAVNYMGMHSLAILILAYRLPSVENNWFNASYWLLVTGVAIFSGSLFLLCLLDVPLLGAITPIGGCAFLLGWLSWLIAELRQQS